MSKPLDDYTAEELEAERKEVFAALQLDTAPEREQIVNILTGETIDVPEGEDPGNYLEMLFS